MPTFTLTDEEWQQFLQMQINLLMNANPVMQKMLTQVQGQTPQAQPAPKPPDKPAEAKSPEVVGGSRPMPFEQKERSR